MNNLADHRNKVTLSQLEEAGGMSPLPAALLT